MPLTLMVHKVTLAPDQPPHRQVQCLHGYIPAKESHVGWCHSHDEAIAHLEKRLFTYFIKRDGKPVPLVIAQTDTGEKFLKARTDADRPDALLTLPVYTRHKLQLP
jgi:hypothetical protein